MSEKMHSVTTLNAREIPIKAVTVFNDRAEINRTFTISLKPGMNEIKLQNIRGRVDEDSIRVNGKGLAVIHEVKFEIEEINIENSELPKVKELFSKLNELKKESQKQKDIQSIYTARIEALDSAVRNIGENSVTGHGSNLVSFNEASETSLENFFEYHERKCIELKEKTRDTAQNISTLDLEVNRINANINRYRMDIGRNCIISIEIENKNAKNVEVEITVTYHVLSAYWSPSYDIRIKDKKENSHEMVLSYFGNIKQSSGEDWNNVELSLSTAKPTSGGDLPKPRRTIVQIYRPPPIHPQTGRILATKAARRSAPACGGPSRIPMNHASTVAKRNALSTTFTISNPKTILTDSDSTQKVTITTQTFDAFLHFYSIPKKNPNVFLMATVFNDSEYPIVYGPATVYVNDSMSGKIFLKSTSPGEKMECLLGVDKTIKVIYKPRDKFQTQIGVISKNVSSGNEQRIRVKNLKQTEPILITLHECIKPPHILAILELLEAESV